MKNVIITGTTSGIGKELVKKFLAENHHVFAIARNEEKLKEVSHPNYHYAVCDLENEAEIIASMAKMPFKEVDILINNAGILLKKPFSEFTYQDFEKSMKINYFAPAKLIQLTEKLFTKNAHIVNISTIGAIQGSVKFPELMVYGGTKSSLIHLTELLAEEWKEREISINCLALGAVQTEMLETAFPGYQANTSAPEMAAYIYDFALLQGKYLNGKVIQVSNSTP